MVVLNSENIWQKFYALLLQHKEFKFFIEKRSTFEINIKKPFPLARLLLQHFPNKEDEILSCIKAATQIPQAYLPLFPIFIKGTQFFSLKEMSALGIIPIAFSEKEKLLAIALFDPFFSSDLKKGFKKTGVRIVPFLSPLTSIRSCIDMLHLTNADAYDAAFPAKDIVDFVDRIINEAAKNGASDIHIEGLSAWSRVRFRIDGYCRAVYSFSLDFHPAIISRIKIMASMDISDKRRPQDGQFNIKTGLQYSLDVRVSSLPTVDGEKIALRLLDSSKIPDNIYQLGFEQRDLELLEKLLSQKEGLILVTGPTGSGKSTTLHALIKKVNVLTLNVTTIEDPVERFHEGINQVEVDERAGRTFEVVLRSLLRQDPDIILVGEIRDSETAHLVMRAALTGHLVLSTLHTDDAANAPLRLIEMGVPPFLIVSSLKAVVSQRLIRLLCPLCKKPDSNSPVGCSYCGGRGFHGRVGVFEYLPITERVQELLLHKAPVQKIRTQARKEGMRTLVENGMLKVERGLTTYEEILSISSGRTGI